MAAPPPPSGGPPRLFYVPTPNEVPYYDALFAAADVQRAGSLGGSEAVRFFQTSGLPIDALKTVWTVADQPATNQLDPRKFAVAVRLIQLLQNNAKGEGAHLAAPPGVTLKPVHFEGITGVRIPLPPPESGGGAAAGAPPQPQQQQQHQQPQPPQQQQPQYGQPPQQQYPQQQLQQQHQHQHPQHPQASMTPPRHPPAPGGSVAGGIPPTTSTALTAQDPYVLTPAERQRYESLFPQYARPDGYVYGAQAVELFSKSGAPQQQLAAIWNMVDIHPVDNRLDPLEFAMAMHLIVCVSKKNLPLPPSLPHSLRILKEPQQQQQPGGHQPPAYVTTQQQNQPQIHSQPGSPISAARNAPMGGGGATAPPSLRLPNQPPQQSFYPPQQQQQAAPSLPSPTPTQQYYQPPPPTPPQQPQQQPQLGGGGVGGGIPTPQPAQYQPHHNHAPPSPAGGRDAASSAFANLPGPPPLTQPGGGGLSISDAFEGLNGGGGFGGGGFGGGSALPPMSAYETPALSFGGAASVASEADEAAYRYEAPAPSPAAAPAPAPVPKTTQQLKDSYHMGEASEELVKLRAILQKLQAENISLKATMGGLTEDEKEVQKELHSVVQEISKLSHDLTSLRAKVLAAKSRLLEATAELKAGHEKKSVITDLIAEANATRDALDDAYQSIERLNEEARAAPPAPAPSSYDGDLFGFDATASRQPTTTAAAPVPQPTVVSQDKSFDRGDANGGGTQPNVHAALAYASYDSSSAGGYGLGTASSGYMEGEGIMGGGKAPLPSDGFGGSGGTDYAGGVPTTAEIADLKKKLKEAEAVARDAEESKRQVVAHADELRKIADEAEEAARRYQNQPESIKKKGFLRGAGKKKVEKDPKEVERLALEAKGKKDKLIEVQSQINDANKLANDTKAEEERLRKQIEDMELKAASVASLQQTQPQSSPQNGGYSVHHQQSNSGDYGGFGGPMGVGGSDFKVSPPPREMGGYGGPPQGLNSTPPTQPDSFNSNVMAADGGFSIPEPTDYDPYMNPFGE